MDIRKLDINDGDIIVLTYGYEIDMWSVGCILFECFFKKVLFSAQKEGEIIYQIYQICGTPHHLPEYETYKYS